MEARDKLVVAIVLGGWGGVGLQEPERGVEAILIPTGVGAYEVSDLDLDTVACGMNRCR